MSGISEIMLPRDAFATGDLDPFDRQRSDLAELNEKGRLRSLRSRAGTDFSSNDYLAFAQAPRLRDAIERALRNGVAVGSGGSRLLRGNDPEHEALEAEAASFFGSEAALYFSTGYAANSALLSTLPQREDLIVHDALVHASAHEGMRLSRAASTSVDHNDVQHFDDSIDRWRRAGGRGTPWIVVESLYSMDGDMAPLDDLASVAAKHDAVLLVDEAHATGVFGEDGRGLAAHLEGQCTLITLRTCGKALGSEGALVCGPQIVRDFLINRGRGFIFSTAPSPLMASAVREALRMLVDEPERRTQLRTLVTAAERALAPYGAVPTGSQILPLILYDDVRTMRAAEALQAAGFDVRGIRPPTVPEGTSRLRISITLNVGLDDIARLSEALSDVLR